MSDKTKAPFVMTLGRITQTLPRPLQEELFYRVARYKFLRYLRKTFGDRYKTGGSGVLPPPELITTEALMCKDDLKVRGKAANYFGAGYRTARVVLTMLQEWGFDLRSMQSVLEFGCGTGRILRHFRHIAELRLEGTDANPKPIAWDRANLPGIDFSENALMPPLKYDDASFDLVYALSVFTHIPFEAQQPWLNELRRVLRPGGYLLCTVHGAAFVNLQLNERERAQLLSEGSLTLDQNHPRASYSTQVLGSWDVFQTREQTRATFGAGFEILCDTTTAAIEGQDALILRKPN